jgi:hypothetical protein
LNILNHFTPDRYILVQAHRGVGEVVDDEPAQGEVVDDESRDKSRDVPKQPDARRR